MNYAIIENGTVVNVVVSDAPLGPNWVQSDVAQIGWTYDGTTFTAPPPAPVPVPEQVSMRQARLALNAQFLLASVEAAIAALPEPDRTNIGIEWEYAHVVDRASPWVAGMGTALGLTDGQMDDLFRLAATL